MICLKNQGELREYYKSKTIHYFYSSYSNFQLSVWRVLPDNCSSVAAIQNSRSIIDSFIEIDSVKHVEFHAIPNGGDVVLTRRGDLDVGQSESSFSKEYCFSRNYPILFTESWRFLKC